MAKSILENGRRLNGNPPANLCVVPHCGRQARSRGLCEGCYQKARELIHYRQTTWEELVNLGLARASDGRRGSPMEEAFRKATKRKGGI